jgi:hypothetical protein
VQTLARGPAVRWDRVFSLYRLVPTRPGANSAPSTLAARTMEAGD